jgi:hypothetical protein
MYLDPGFGGMLIQILVAMAAAAGALLFTMRKKIRELLSKKNEANETSKTDAKIISKDTVINTTEEDIIDILADEDQ